MSANGDVGLVNDVVHVNGAAGAGARRDTLTAPGWRAELRLAFERVGDRTVLARRRHRGPLVVQKPLYPEGPGLCQCVIVHPPAGIVADDRLSLAVSLGAKTCVQLTTPGAAKWYRSSGPEASQTIVARLDDDATLEWLPQGTIVYDGARARSAMTVDLGERSTFIGADVVALGRRASGERFRCGVWHQRIDIVQSGAFLWSERAVIDGSSSLVDSLVGLKGAAVFGTLVATGPRVDEAPMSRLREVAALTRHVGVTMLPRVFVARYLGESMESALHCFSALWAVLRPLLVERPAVPPRVWRT